MRLQHYIIIVVAGCFLQHAVFCQSIDDQLTRYTTKDGLPDGLINCIQQDNSGFLWLGTSNGLARFDGRNFKIYRYNSSDTISLRTNIIGSLFIDHRGRLWALSYPWLHLYHPETECFEHFNINGFTTGHLVKICAEENDQLIFAGSKSLYKFDMKQKKFASYHEDLKPSLYLDYIKDEDGIEWMTTRTGLMRYDPKTKINFFIDSAIQHNKNGLATVSYLFLLPDGYMLAATRNWGILLVNRKKNTIKQFFPYNNNQDVFRDMYKCNDSTFLVMSDSGVFVFNWREGSFTGFMPKVCITTLRDIKAVVFYDREGIVWVGGKYLEKYDVKDFKIRIVPCNEKDPEPFDRYNNLYKCNNGTILLGGNSVIAIFDSLRRLVAKIHNEVLDSGFTPYGKIINNFREDGKGNIWCSARPDLACFSIKNNSINNVKKYHSPRNFSEISDLMPDSKGGILLATHGKGFARFDTTKKTFTFFDTRSVAPSRITDLYTTSICIDHNGCTWIGTAGGMNKIEKDGITVMQFKQNKNNSASNVDWYVTDIKEDKHGIIWFTTREYGIGRLNPLNDSVTFLSTGQGLPTCYFSNLDIDDGNNLWALSAMGILKLNTTTLHSDLYTEEEGFPPPDNIRYMHYCKYTGSLYLLTPGAIFEIDTRKNIDHHIKIPETSITEFSVFNKEKPIFGRKDINLNYNENFINIQFACLLFHNVKQIKYAYKMDGIDKDWVYCNFKRNASYTNLPPGHYNFMVKAQGPEGAWNKPTVLSLIITPPYWQSWWFYMAEVIFGIAIVIWVVKLYTKGKLATQKSEFEKLRAVSDERTRIAAEMHDELGSGLTSIRMLSEIANGKINHNITPKHEIEKIESSASHLSENLREIIWTMNTRFDKLDDFIVYVRSYAAEYFDDSSIFFQFNIPEIIPDITLNGELRRNIFLCIKEALHNIMKHSLATKADLTFNFIGKTLIIEIKDNGVGIDFTQNNKFGSGLSNMKERLSKFGSGLEINVNGGTKLVFKINIQPLTASH